MKNSGFTLIEFLVYLALFSIIVLLVNQWVVISLGPTQQSMKRMRTGSALYAACEVLIRDVHNGSKKNQNWDITGSQKISWYIKRNYICWEIKENSLFRSEGGIKNGIFYKKNENLIAQNIDGYFDVKKRNERIHRVECSLSNGIEKIEIVASPRLEGVI